MRTAVLRRDIIGALALCAIGLIVQPKVGRTQTLQESSCVTCHKLLDGELLAAVTAMQNDIHAQNGIGCEGCHGGNPSPAVAEDPEAAKSRAAGFIGKPSR
jgi:hypothetical protein